MDPAGHPVKFWGVNLVALYPEHSSADALAANLAALQVNLVRPHHLLRQSLDWNPHMVSGSLVKYKENSREFDPDALDRFDYLNAALQRHGIYLALSAHFTRHYLPGDVDILKTTDEDRRAWMAAMTELNSWNWKKSRDPCKILPVIDERAALLCEEFVQKLLMHVNPYTGRAYADDPQVLTLEIINEASTEYAIICGNRFPDYWQQKLEARWKDFATAAGIEPGDLYKPADSRAVEIRAQFLRKLDEDYFTRIKKVIRATGCRAATTFSNLWFGENELDMQARHADYIENHNYMDPVVTRGLDDGFVWLSRTALADKPYVIGELNESEGASNIQKQAPQRAMLPVAASAYCSLQNWDGIVWFAWLHGDSMLATNGWARTEGRDSALGNLISDGMMLDHMRTTGLIFRRGLVAPSKGPVTLWIDEPFAAGNYNTLMAGKRMYRPGWQNVHEIRKRFGAVPAGQSNAVWMTESPANPVVSDTGQIMKDIKRSQLTVAAPQAEAFSGYLDGKPPAGLKHLRLTGEGFATVVVVADDGRDFAATRHLIISRTHLTSSNVETNALGVELRGLRKASWSVQVTRPRPGAAPVRASIAGGVVMLPAGDWHECELISQP